MVVSFPAAVCFAFLFIVYVGLALLERKTVVQRFAYALGTMLMLFAGVSAAGVEFGNPSRHSHPAEGLLGIMHLRLVLAGFGGWLAVMAVGELLRIALGRMTSEVLGPVVLFLAGVLLVEPSWAVGVAFTVAVAGVVWTEKWRLEPTPHDLPQ